MSDVWIVRHGETEWSASGRHTSTTDLPLTGRGREQAQVAARAVEGHAFAEVLCSPLLRARETAELLGHPQPTLDEDLHELRYGAYEGRTTPEIREEVPGWTVFTHPCPEGETLAQVAERCDRVLARARAADGDVLCVAHGHVLRILAARWLEQDAAFGARLVLGTAGLGVLGSEHGVPGLLRWNAS